MRVPEDAAGIVEPLVLDVDDDVVLAAEATALFQRCGFRTDQSGAWGEAMGKPGARQPDAILLDQPLAGVDAVARIALMREATDAPILVVTANADAADRILGLEQGADDFLVTPVAGRELVARPGQAWPAGPATGAVDTARSGRSTSPAMHSSHASPASSRQSPEKS